MISNQYRVAAAFIAATIILIFCSCNRQISSLASLKKLDCKQTLASENSRSLSSPPKEVVNNLPPLQVTATASPALPNVKEKIKYPVLNIRIGRPAERKVAQKVEKAIQNQTASIRNTFSDRHISMYSKTFDTGGFLGLAVLCLIAGIVLAYLGFHALAALLWVIGIILLAAAILFFILWLIGRAVAD